MRTPLTTLLLPLALLLVLAPAGEAWTTCTTSIIPPLGKSCDRAGCQFQSRIEFTQIGCHVENATGCTWTGECVSEGCQFTICVTITPTPAPS